MAMIFGIQLLATLIIGLFMTKIFSIYSYSLMIFYNTWFVVPPMADQLGEFSQAYKDHAKRKPRNKDEKKTPLEDFTIPRDSDIKYLRNRIVSTVQISKLPQCEDIDLLVMMSASSVIIYIVTEVSMFLKLTPQTDLHLSYIWTLVVLLFALRFLSYMLKVYIQLGGGERSLCFLSTFLFVVFALFTSMADKQFIDFGIEEGYREFAEEFLNFANSSNLIASQRDVVLPSTKAFKGVLVVVSGLVGALLTFPSFRFGALNSRMLLSTSKSDSCWKERAVAVLVHFNVIAPAVVALLWCRPLVQTHIEAHMGVSAETFCLMRIGFIALVMVVRLASVKLYLQVHLNTARSYLSGLRREAGRVDHKTIQQKVAYIFQYSSVVVLQILAPCCIVIQLCLLLLSLHQTPSSLPSLPSSPSPLSDLLPDLLLDSSRDLNVIHGIRGVLTKGFLSSVASYFTWWIVSVTAGVSLFSTVYHHMAEQV